MSATGGFDTEVPTMQVAAGHVRDVNSQIQGQLSSLLSRLEPLMGSWQGAAATSFDTLEQRWHDNATRLNQALLGISEGLAQSKDTYATTEDTNVADFSRVNANLE
ncbi:MAG: WXG100 family type VII secretion target [Egibacteraceae bacterium]